jgi:hypothetical protein
LPEIQYPENFDSAETTPFSVIASVAKQSSFANEINKGLICAK